jgi:hypothetical protein
MVETRLGIKLRLPGRSGEEDTAAGRGAPAGAQQGGARSADEREVGPAREMIGREGGTRVDVKSAAGIGVIAIRLQRRDLKMLRHGHERGRRLGIGIGRGRLPRLVDAAHELRQRHERQHEHDKRCENFEECESRSKAQGWEPSSAARRPSRVTESEEARPHNRKGGSASPRARPEQ